MQTCCDHIEEAASRAHDYWLLISDVFWHVHVLFAPARYPIVVYLVHCSLCGMFNRLHAVPAIQTQKQFLSCTGGTAPVGACMSVHCVPGTVCLHVSRIKTIWPAPRTSVISTG